VSSITPIVPPNGFVKPLRAHPSAFSTLSMAKSRCNLVHANGWSIMIDLP
jgi:hypothetical protein